MALRLRLVVGVTAVVLVATAGLALAAAPIGGARYTGFTRQNFTVGFVLSPDGSQVTSYTFSGRYRCNRRSRLGKITFGVGGTGVNPPPIPVHGSTFKLSLKRKVKFIGTSGKTLARGRTREYYKGSFRAVTQDSPGYVSQNVRGTLRAKFRGRRGRHGRRKVRCDSRKVRWTARTTTFAPH